MDNNPLEKINEMKVGLKYIITPEEITILRMNNHMISYGRSK